MLTDQRHWPCTARVESSRFGASLAVSGRLLPHVPDPRQLTSELSIPGMRRFRLDAG